MMIGTDFRFPGKVAFKCKPHYTLMGEPELQCLGTGQWSGPAPSCYPLMQASDVLKEQYEETLRTVNSVSRLLNMREMHQRTQDGTPGASGNFPPGLSGLSESGASGIGAAAGRSSH